MADKKAILICGHGSKNESGVKAFLELFLKLKASYSDFEVQYGFIEYSSPSLEESIDKIVEQGINEIIIVPAILFTGVHIKYDIPYIINEKRKKNPNITIKLTGYIGINNSLISLGEKHISSALKKSGINDIKNTNLLLIGVGSSQEKANADIASLTRYIWNKTGVNLALYAFISQMTFPSIEETLETLNKLPQEYIVILPFLLFPGVYLDKIYLKIENFKRFSNKKIIITKTLENDELMTDALRTRIEEVITGEKNFAKDIPKDIQPRVNTNK